ncbi:MAG: alkaline phosphatase family protein [Sedimentisphaerales bacterium]|nr:alkaline phosphatase family protein [Sedimentisphaerales bacterium]
MTKNKILFFGIDGGSWSVLKPAFESGQMPFLQSLSCKGVSGVLQSTIPAITPAAWGAFQSGKNPGRTGVFDFEYWDKEQKRGFFVSSDCLGQTVWDILSGEGYRVGLMNVPMTYPPRPINGVVVSGLPTPSMESAFTYPPEIKEQLLALFPGYHIFNIQFISQNLIDDPILLTEALCDIVKIRADAACWLLDSQPFDVFMVHFQANDVIQHMLWHYLDPRHPGFSKSIQTEIFRRFHKVLDDQIQRIYTTFLKNNGSIDLCCVLSDHGFGPHFKRFNLGNWLVQEGYLKLSDVVRMPLLKKITRTLRVGKLLNFFITKDKVGRMEHAVLKSKAGAWDHIRAFSVGRSNEGFIYLLEQEAALRESLAKEITGKLQNVTDPVNGRKIVHAIYRKEDIYKGQRMDHLPDLIIDPAEGYSFTGHVQANSGLFSSVQPPGDRHIGKHHKDGIIILHGKDIAARGTLTASLYDIIPTLLYMLRIGIPAVMDGRILQELFSEDYLKQNAPILLDAKDCGAVDGPEHGYSADDEKNIEQRLRDLGYL